MGVEVGDGAEEQRLPRPGRTRESHALPGLDEEPEGTSPLEAEGVDLQSGRGEPPASALGHRRGAPELRGDAVQGLGPLDLALEQRHPVLPDDPVRLSRSTTCGHLVGHEADTHALVVAQQRPEDLGRGQELEDVTETGGLLRLLTPKRRREMIPIRGCPPAPQSTLKALRKAGIDVNPDIFKNIENAPLRFMKRYEGKAEFDESFYTIT